MEVLMAVQSDALFRALGGSLTRKIPTRRGGGSNDFFRLSCFLPTIRRTVAICRALSDLRLSSRCVLMLRSRCGCVDIAFPKL